MSLFAVNRYVEEDENLNDGNRYEYNLSRLKARIEERRKAKEAVKISPKVIENTADDDIQEDEKQVDEDINIDKELIDEEPANQDVENISENKSIPQFKILGVQEFEKKIKVKRVLPYWLSHPIPLSINLKEHNCEIQNIQFLHDSLKKKLTSEGIEYLFPVQAKVIPWLLQENKKSEMFWPRDLCVSAPTGSGKTLAYVLPIVQALTNRVEKQVRALIVLPVKELAVQVAKVFKDYCIGTNLKVALITGSMSFQQEQSELVKYSNISGWHSKVDIVVCTAGRLVEHIKNTEGFILQNLRFLVIDEADRIMQYIQNDWLYHLNHHVEFGNSLITGSAPPLCAKVVNTLRRPPQKLFFSATLSQDPEKLKEWGLFQPVLFTVFSESTDDSGARINTRRYTTPLELTEKYTVCDLEHKPAILYHLLNIGFKRVLCFTNSAQSTHRLSILLKHMFGDRLSIAEISATLNKNARESVMKKFKAGSINILISTDALARGVDIVDCDSVISYDPPKNVKTYIHRIGRTGRAGKEGTAFIILTRNQLKSFMDILKFLDKQNMDKVEVQPDDVEKILGIYQIAMEKSKEELDEESTNHVAKLKSLKRGKLMSGMYKKKRKTINHES